MLASPGLVRLVELATRQDRLPANSKRGLLKALVLVGAAQDNSETGGRDQYWGQVRRGDWTDIRKRESCVTMYWPGAEAPGDPVPGGGGP